MNNLIVKEVEFNNSDLLAIQNKETGEIYTSINLILRGLDFNEDQIRYQREKWNEDKAISKGVGKFSHPSEKGGIQETFCINIKKLPLALAKIRITPKMQQDNPEIVEILEKYQDECADVLAEAFIHKSVTIKRKKPIDMVFKQNMNIAKLLSEHTGVSSGIAYAVAITRTEQLTGEDLTEYKKLIPAIDKKYVIGTMNATAVGETIGLSARSTNLMLKNRGLQYKNGNDWRLTDSGKLHGEEFPYNRNGHSGYRILWNETLIDLLLEDNIPELLTNDKTLQLTQ